jgi:hypothetical protein
LHLAGTEQLADHLHAIEQKIVDDGQRRIGLHRLGEVVAQALLVAIDAQPPDIDLEQATERALWVLEDAETTRDLAALAVVQED